MAMDDNESCGSRAMEPLSPKQNRLQRQKAEVFNQVLTRLQELNLEEVKLPGFEDQLWLHFNRLPARLTFINPIFPHFSVFCHLFYFVLVN